LQPVLAEAEAQNSPPPALPALDPSSSSPCGRAASCGVYPVQ